MKPPMPLLPFEVAELPTRRWARHQRRRWFRLAALALGVLALAGLIWLRVVH